MRWIWVSRCGTAIAKIPEIGKRLNIRIKRACAGEINCKRHETRVRVGARIRSGRSISPGSIANAADLAGVWYWSVIGYIIEICVRANKHLHNSANRRDIRSKVVCSSVAIDIKSEVAKRVSIVVREKQSALILGWINCALIKTSNYYRAISPRSVSIGIEGSLYCTRSLSIKCAASSRSCGIEFITSLFGTSKIITFITRPAEVLAPSRYLPLPRKPSPHHP